MSSDAAATAPIAAASRPSRRGRASSMPPPDLFEERGYESASNHRDRRRGRRLAGDRVRALRATSARCSASSSGAPCAATTLRRFRSKPGRSALAAVTDQREQLRRFAADIVLRLERVGADPRGPRRRRPRGRRALRAARASCTRNGSANLRVLVDAWRPTGRSGSTRKTAVETRLGAGESRICTGSSRSIRWLDPRALQRLAVREPRRAPDPLAGEHLQFGRADVVVLRRAVVAVGVVAAGRRPGRRR